MYKKKDVYSFTNYVPLITGGNTIGMIYLDYQVSLYDDVQVIDFTSVQRKPVRKYLLHCTQRVNIYNPNSENVNPIPGSNSYNNYPVMLNTLINVEMDTSGYGDYELLEYNPVTVNTKIDSSSSNSDSKGTTMGSSVSNTVGSSTSQTNSFGASVTVSEIPSATESYDYSSTSSSDHSSTNTNDTSNTNSNEASDSASMSVKDWGAYAFLNPVTKSPTWTFGQEYPWDVIQSRTTTSPPIYNDNNKNQVQLLITQATINRLYDGVLLYPPSQLSVFGVNFATKAAWLITLDDTNGSDDITLNHTINYYTGSHVLSGGIPIVYMDKSPTILDSQSISGMSTSINLAVMSLDPLSFQNKSSIIGFAQNKFIITPSPYIGSSTLLGFKIASPSNNLIIYDTTQYPDNEQSGGGFSIVQSILQASFSQAITSLMITAYFKVTDTVNDYTLFLKHWIAGETNISLSIIINGDQTNVITKYVDSVEGEGGENNLLSIALRDLDYSSINYHDYLQLGLNSIEITITQLTNANNGVYGIKAISIEKV